MGKIVLLDELTINKIAAGEVIERPASVVKEMVENSIDAEATNINIEIEGGGISKIRITDNGKGIEKDDMVIAFERHATSKIRMADDLETVKSMGFRGEALASIAAIAKVEMISRTANSEIGNRVVVEGGKVLIEEEIGCPVGTTITVENLFFNTPVRYKFLKKDYTESGYIEDAVTRIALINPNVAIKLVNTGKTVIQTSGNGDMKSVIYNIYGKDIAEGILDVEYEYEGIKLKGVVGKPEIARSNRTNQLFFVNKRFVKDKTLTSAIEQAFKGLLPIGKFGFVVLNIEMNPKQVDVNVHPAKLEVRFQEENKVFKAVYHAIKESLLQGNLMKDNPFAPSGLKENETQAKIQRLLDEVNKKFEQQETNSIENKEIESNIKPYKIIEAAENKMNINIPEQEDNIAKVLSNENVENTIAEKVVPLVEEQAISIDVQGAQNLEQNEGKNIIEAVFNKRQNLINTPTEEQVALATERLGIQNKSRMEDTIELKEDTVPVDIKNIESATKLKQETITNLNFDEMYTKMFGKKFELPPKKDEIKTEYANTSNMSVFENEAEYEAINYKFIGIAFSTYIIVQINDEIYIIDQHAAHERVMYEKIKKNFYDNKEKESQLMLVPDVITLSHKEMGIAQDNKDIFEKAGFTFEEFGENTIKLTGVPNICMEMNTKELFLDILDEINTVARTARQEVEEKFIATIACKAAVKANMKLTEEEVDELMRQILKLPNPFTCPHGRPTAIKMSKAEIEKKFARR